MILRPTTDAPSSSSSFSARPLPQFEHLLSSTMKQAANAAAAANANAATAHAQPRAPLLQRRQPIVRRMSTECIAWTPPEGNSAERRGTNKMRTTSAGGPEEFQRLLQNRYGEEGYSDKNIP